MSEPGLFPKLVDARALTAFRLATYDRDTASELVKAWSGSGRRAPAGRTGSGGRGSSTRSRTWPLIRGVIIVRTGDADQVVGFLEDHGAGVHMRIVTVIRKDRNRLQV